MQNWKLYLWAAMHSDKFWMCHINLPITIKMGTSRAGEQYYVRFDFTLSLPRPYIPWDVKDQYYKSFGLTPKYDDIPF
jgi:hypothetical protein